MIKSVAPDLLFICAELVTGKSIPVLVGITRLPVGQVLTWVMVSMGAIAGTLFSVWAAHNTGGMTLLGFVNRLLQLCFSLGLSLSLVLSLAGGVHAERGVALAVIPAFCSIVQPLPQRHSTALVSFGLCCLAVYVCMTTPLASDPVPPALIHHKAAIMRREGNTEPATVLSLGEVVGRAIQLFVLAFYACLQHAPTQLYFQVEGVGGGAVYASHHHARHAVYTLFVGLVSAWIRLCVWSSVCFFQDNHFHSMLGNEPVVGGWDWICCIVYATALLFSACWTCTQLGEQVLPRFCISSRVGGLKFVALILGVAALFRQRDPALIFWGVDLLVGLCVLSSVIGLEGL